MKYMGSKNRIAKHLLPIMLEEAEKRGITKWVEPFVGGGGMIDKVPDSFERVGYDLNPHTIQAMLDIRDIADKLPETVTEEEYKSYKGLSAQSVTSWVRFVCSFGGKFENGYARENGSDETTFCGYGKRNALKQSPKIQNVQFICDSYENLDFENCIIYNDPPYKNSTGYKTGKFDHDKFYDWCREQAKKNIVFVSEYEMPDVSELVDGDYYLFHLTDDKMYIYKDGVVCINNIDLQKEESHYRVPYTNGTLQEFIEGLGD